MINTGKEGSLGRAWFQPTSPLGAHPIRAALTVSGGTLKSEGLCLSEE